MEGLTNAQIERLAILSEECSEVIHVASKILRHGYNSYNPNDSAGESNTGLLQRELGDLEYAISLCVKNGDIDPKQIERFKGEKQENIKQYLHYNEA